MTEETRIAVDAMGGDGGPSVIMPSINDFLSKHDDVKIEVYGNEKEIIKHTKKFDQSLKSNIEIIHTEERF